MTAKNISSTFINTSWNPYNVDATINIIDHSSNDMCVYDASIPLIERNKNNQQINVDVNAKINLHSNLNQNSLPLLYKSEKNSNDLEEGSSNQIRGRKRQQEQIQNNSHSSWPIRQQDRSFERLQSASDMRSQREQQTQDEALQLG